MILALFVSLCGCSDFGLTNYLGGTFEDTEKSNFQRAQEIKKEIEAIPQISNCTVVISGHTALMGLVTKQNDQEEKERLKKEAAKRTRQTDQGITSTAITCNPEIIQMIEAMAKGQNTEEE